MKITAALLRRLISEELYTLNQQLILEEEEKEEKEDPDADLFGDESEDSGSEDTDAEAEDTESEDSGSEDTEAEAEDTESEDTDAGETVPEEEVEERVADAEEEGVAKAIKHFEPAAKIIAKELEDALRASTIDVSRTPTNESYIANFGLFSTGRNSKSLASLLFEADSPEEKIDVRTYAQKVANLITNYDKLLDMEKTIFDAAYNQLSENEEYGEQVADEFKDILAREYDIHFDHTYDPEKAERDVYAVGASSTAAAAT